MKQTQKFGLHAAGLAGLLLAIFVTGVALIGQYVVTSSPLDFIGPPFQSGHLLSPFGTDVLGRDVLSRVLSGGQYTFILALASASIGVVTGTVTGVFAGFRGGLWDATIMRICDGIIAFPQLVLALLLISLTGPEPWAVLLVVSAFHVPQVARLVRSATISCVAEDYILYARSIGIPNWRILLQEIMPNISRTIAVEFGLRVTFSIATIASLSFLGLGLQPPAPDWGLMINENRIGLASNPWPVILPISMIVALTIGINLFIDALFEATPRSIIEHASDPDANEVGSEKTL